MASAPAGRPRTVKTPKAIRHTRCVPCYGLLKRPDGGRFLPVIRLSSIEQLGDMHIAPTAIGVLPVAATEPHGPHLPVSTDCDIAEGHLAALENWIDPAHALIILPVERIGASAEHSAFPGCQSAEPAALILRWTEIAGQFAAAGGRRLVIISSHGGNTPAVDATILAARVQYGLLAVATAWLRFGQPEGLFPDAELRHGIHGGAVETALMLHYAPHKVDLSQLRDFPSAFALIEQCFAHLSAFGRHRFGWMSQDLNPLGVVGDARTATAASGAASAAHALKGFAALLDDVARFDLDFFRDAP